MDKAKLAKLEAAGWTQVTVQEFLKLSADEVRFLEVRSRVAEALKGKRLSLGLTQTAVAQCLKTSQSRVAKMEAADSSVTLDLMIQSLFKLGASAESLAVAISPQMERTSTAVVKFAVELPMVSQSFRYSPRNKNNYTTPKNALRLGKDGSANMVSA